jgi:hypothetical protein
VANQTRGVELMREIQDGRTEYAPSAYLIETRELVSAEIDELLDVGARIRPLLLGTERVGWVRGVHLAERNALKRWITNDLDFIQHLIRLGTTLTDAAVEDLNMVEIRSIWRVIQTTTESDLTLYSFIGPFVTTNTSEQLWYSQGSI